MGTGGARDRRADEPALPFESARLVAPGRTHGAVVGVAVATVLAGVDLLLPAPVPGLLVVGPTLAAVSARPRTVVAVGGYALILVLLLSGPDGLWWTLHQAVYVSAVVGVTAVDAVIAGRRVVFEKFVGQAARQRAALDTVVQSSPDAIISKTVDGIITSWNAGAARMYGYTAEEAIGRPISLITNEAEAAEIPGILRRIARGERVEPYETRRRHKNGDVVNVSVSISPLVDPATGAVVGAWAVARDITSRVRAEAERQALQEVSQQAQRLQSLGQLAGGIAHDFNNLLSVISNYTAFVAEHTTANPEVQADLDRVQTAARRAAQLTSQLLTFARHETVQPQVLDLNTVVSEVRDLLERILGEHIELVVVAGADLPAVLIDRGQIEQVIVNLAINARDAMPDGGTLVIQTGETTLEPGQTQLHPTPNPGRYVQLSVSDTGTGMTPEITARMFEPFFTTKPKGQGTGLGLATVYGIVTEDGGSLSVYSEPGIGTTIRVYLAAVQAAPTTVNPPVREHPAPGTGQTILVVEDQPELLALMERILTRHGFTVLVAANGPEALTLADHHRVDMLLTDVVMPQMSGPELSTHIHRRQPGLPVLFVSGYSDGLLGPRRILDPDVHLLQKPFAAHELIDEVNRTLSEAKPTPSGPPS